MKPLILASGSPRRAKILRDLGVEFEIVKTEAPEVSIPHDPVRTVTENACAKLHAAAVAQERDPPGAVTTSCDPPEVVGRAILAADTIVWFDNRIYGKPRDLEEAKEFLRELSGQTHVVFTGVAFWNGKGEGALATSGKGGGALGTSGKGEGALATACVRSEVTFRKLSEEMIDDYVARVHPTDRAGAYDIDEAGDLVVASYTGSYENIMGLPVEPLRDFGICVQNSP